MPIHAASPSVRSRRRPVRAIEQIHQTSSRPSLAAKVVMLANTRTARTAFVIVGTAGLAALTLAILGPKRLEREIIRPLRGAIEPQAEKLWSEAKPLREQIARLFRTASPTGREKLVRDFQSWIGHFHAT